MKLFWAFGFIALFILAILIAGKQTSWFPPNAPKEITKTIYNLPDTLGSRGEIWVKRKFIQWHIDTVNNIIYTTDSIYYTRETLYPYFGDGGFMDSVVMGNLLVPVKHSSKRPKSVSTVGNNSPAIQSDGNVIVQYEN